MLTVSVTSSVSTAKVKPKQLEAIATKICTHLGLQQAELSIHFVGPQKMRTLNREYRDKDKSTDVLSFSQMFFTKPLKVQALKKTKIKTKKPSSKRNRQPSDLLGDVVISLTDAQSNARTAGHTTDQEVCLLIVHGILHLCGHDHELLAEEKIMFREQAKLMEILSGKNSSSNAKPEWRGCVNLRGKK